MQLYKLSDLTAVALDRYLTGSQRHFRLARFFCIMRREMLVYSLRRFTGVLTIPAILRDLFLLRIDGRFCIQKGNLFKVEDIVVERVSENIADPF